MLRSLALLLLLVIATACSGPPCRNQNDCPFGSYCVAGSSGNDGVCESDCLSLEDCPAPANSSAAYAICTNEGRCGVVTRSPRLTILEPETDTVFPEGTRAIRVSGEISTAADSVTINVTPASFNGCAGGVERGVTVKNDTPGQYQKMTFAIDGLELDPGPAQLNVSATIPGLRENMVQIELECPGCARIALQAPLSGASTSNLELPELRGTISPAVRLASWRVRSATQDVLDGVFLADPSGDFRVERLPLFPGQNRIEVVASGVGTGFGEARCSTIVTSAVGREVGLRALLSWDGPSSDLDLHVVGPDGRFGDPFTSLSARSLSPRFGGVLEDDPLGFGPEVARIEAPPDGVYGLIVEPIVDGSDFGSDATLRLLFDGRAVMRGPAGPRHVTSLDGKLWVAGTVTISQGAVSWEPIDEIVSAATPPTRPPQDWPIFY